MITINIDPMLEIGPVTIAWHGLTVAIGLVIGGLLAIRVAGERGLDKDQTLNLVLLIAVAGMVGARAFYLLENDPSALPNPGDWLGSRGFSFYGGILFGVPAVAIYLRRQHLDVRYLDALAAGFPLGMAVGRIGDVINGEHYGPVSDLPWAVRNANPDADVPSNALAYHSGGLYEVVLALAMFALIWPMRERFRRPGSLLWTVIGTYALGRFLMFFVRDDSTNLTLGLSVTQWTSVGLFAIACVGLVVSRRTADAGDSGRTGSDRPGEPAA